MHNYFFQHKDFNCFLFAIKRVSFMDVIYLNYDLSSNLKKKNLFTIYL